MLYDTTQQTKNKKNSWKNSYWEDVEMKMTFEIHACKMNWMAGGKEGKSKD